MFNSVFEHVIKFRCSFIIITYGCFFHLKRTRDLCYTHNLQGLPRGDVSSAKLCFMSCLKLAYMYIYTCLTICCFLYFNIFASVHRDPGGLIIMDIQNVLQVCKFSPQNEQVIPREGNESARQFRELANVQFVCFPKVTEMY